METLQKVQKYAKNMIYFLPVKAFLPFCQNLPQYHIITKKTKNKNKNKNKNKKKHQC